MGDIVLAGPSLLYVSWGCRRCGHKGGVARTTVPVVDGSDWNTDLMRKLLDDCRRHLVAKHYLRERCAAVRDDFIIEKFVPQGKTLLDAV